MKPSVTKKLGVFDDCCAIKTGNIGNGLVGGVATPRVAVLVLFEDCVDSKAVRPNDIHIIEYAVVDTGVGSAAIFHWFLLDMLAQAWYYLSPLLDKK